MFTPTEMVASQDDDLSPEVRKKLELAISQRLNPQKAIMQSMHEIRAYAIREGLTNEILGRVNSNLKNNSMLVAGSLSLLVF